MSDKKIMRPEGGPPNRQERLDELADNTSVWEFHADKVGFGQEDIHGALAPEGETVSEADARKDTAFLNEKGPTEGYLKAFVAAYKEPLGESDTEDHKQAYSSLKDVLSRAYDQAAKGKGKERHAQGQRFENQPMQTISQLISSSDGMRYQAIKKIQEAGRMGEQERRTAELLGAINYIAGIIIYEEKSHE